MLIGELPVTYVESIMTEISNYLADWYSLINLIHIWYANLSRNDVRKACIQLFGVETHLHNGLSL